MTRIYLAGPLFCKSEWEYNLALKKELKEAGHDLVLPQDNDGLFDIERMSDRDYAISVSDKVFEADLELLDSCDALLINLDGRVPDEGACIELGYAYARNKKVYGIKTDSRVSAFGIDNMMIVGILGDRIAHSVPELLKFLQ